MTTAKHEQQQRDAFLRTYEERKQQRLVEEELERQWQASKAKRKEDEARRQRELQKQRELEGNVTRIETWNAIHKYDCKPPMLC